MREESVQHHQKQRRGTSSRQMDAGCLGGAVTTVFHLRLRTIDSTGDDVIAPYERNLREKRSMELWRGCHLSKTRRRNTEPDHPCAYYYSTRKSREHGARTHTPGASKRWSRIYVPKRYANLENDNACRDQASGHDGRQECVGYVCGAGDP